MKKWHLQLQQLPDRRIDFYFPSFLGAIAYRVFRTQDKFKVKLIHGAIHSGAIIFAILGLITVFDFHNVNHIPNLYSLHSWIGLATVILFACQVSRTKVI